jgi:hypothetical protein
MRDSLLADELGEAARISLAGGVRFGRCLP